jgi:predicted PP-loop superfamily ATPase
MTNKDFLQLLKVLRHEAEALSEAALTQLADREKARLVAEIKWSTQAMADLAIRVASSSGVEAHAPSPPRRRSRIGA